MRAFELQKIVITALVTVGILATYRWAGRVDGAAAFLGVKELADFAVNLVFLPAHDALVAVGFLEEFLLSFGERHIKVLGDALGIPVLHFNDRVGAAIARTFHAVV